MEDSKVQYFYHPFTFFVSLSRGVVEKYHSFLSAYNSCHNIIPPIGLPPPWIVDEAHRITKRCVKIPLKESTLTEEGYDKV